MPQADPVLIALVTDELPPEAQAAVGAIEHFATERKRPWRIMQTSLRRRSRIPEQAIWVVANTFADQMALLAGRPTIAMQSSSGRIKAFQEAGVVLASQLDQGQFGKLAADHLHSCGYPLVACAREHKRPHLGERLRGFRQRAAELPLPVVDFPKFLPTAHRQIRQWLAYQSGPVGLFMPDDGSAHYWRHLLSESGIHIPGQLGLVGCNNDPVYAVLENPALTTVDLPWFAMGTNTARCIDALSQGQPPPQAFITTPVHIVTRQSTVSLNSANETMRRAELWLAEHIDLRDPVTGLTRELGCSRTTLNRLFQTAHRQTPKEYHLKLRMARACECLVQPEAQNLATIAKKCGYASASAFVQAFKRIHGISPGRWREQKHRD